MQMRAAGACWSAAAWLALGTAPAMAQSIDEARLSIGIGAGWIGGTPLWDVPTQTILSVTRGSDLFHLHRDVASGVTLSGHATYFHGAHVGLTGEFTYLGLDPSDSCTLVQDGGDPGLALACAAIATSPSSIASTNVQGGIVLRPLGDAVLRPYVKGMAGIAFVAGSALAMRSFYRGNNVLTIYQDDEGQVARPTWTVAMGFTTALRPGYQFFAEARATWLREGEVTGPTAAQGALPPSIWVTKHFPSVIAGLDIVLENRRGRRN